MKNSIFSAVLTVFLTLSLSPSSYAIVGGKIVAADDPIARTTVGIAIVTPNGGMGICTGTLISASHVLSAGHCATGASNRLFIVFGTSFDAAKDPTRIRQVVARKIAPSFIIASTGGDDSSDHSDVSILTFAGGIPQGLGYATARLMTRELAKTVMKDEARITLAGYGASDYYASEGSGVLRKINTKISKFYVSGKSVKVGTSAHGACHGDSGGPAIITAGGVNYVFAVTSRATVVGNDGTCSGRAIYSLIY